MGRPLRGIQEVQGLGGVKEVRRGGEDFLSRRRDAGSPVQGVSGFFFFFVSEQKPPSDLEGPAETKTRTPGPVWKTRKRIPSPPSPDGAAGINQEPVMLTPCPWGGGRGGMI